MGKITSPERLYQCPGCWGFALLSQPDGGVECHCGQRMTLLDLRERREQPLNEDAY